MRSRSKIVALAGALALGAATMGHPAAAGAPPAYVQSTGESPQCIAAYRNAGNDSSPPHPSAGAVIQMQYLLYLYAEQIRAVREHCGGWQLQQKSISDLQGLYDQTLETCRQVASSPADCRPVGNHG